MTQAGKPDGKGYVPKIRVREINIDVFLALCVSHSKLSQAEYNRNPSYNDEHFSHIAEVNAIVEIERLGLMTELFDLM